MSDTIYSREVADQVDRDRGLDLEYDEYGHHTREVWYAKGGYWFRCVGPDEWIRVSAVGGPEPYANPNYTRL